MDKKNGFPGWTVALTLLALTGMACSLVSGLTATRTPLRPTRVPATNTLRQPTRVPATSTLSQPTAVKLATITATTVMATVAKATEAPGTAIPALFTPAVPRPHPQAQGLSMGDPKALVVVVAYVNSNVGGALIIQSQWSQTSLSNTSPPAKSTTPSSLSALWMNIPGRSEMNRSMPLKPHTAPVTRASSGNTMISCLLTSPLMKTVVVSATIV